MLKRTSDDVANLTPLVARVMGPGSANQ